MIYAIDLFNDSFDAYYGDNTILYGISYGTYFLNKYLQVYPDPNPVRAVILDGVCAGTKCKIADYDQGVQDTAVTFFNRCGQDSFCKAQFVPEYGDTIFEAIDYIYSLFDDNDGNIPCNPIQDQNKTITKTMFQLHLFSYIIGVHRRLMIMPLLKRIARCNADDLDALNAFVSAAYSIYGSESDSFEIDDAYEYDNVLGQNILLSELWYGDDPTVGGPDYETMVELQEDYYSAGDLKSVCCYLCKYLKSTAKVLVVVVLSALVV